jgi:hypothetical protein
MIAGGFVLVGPVSASSLLIIWSRNRVLKFYACASIAKTARRVLSPLATKMINQGRQDPAATVNVVDESRLARSTQHHFSALDGLRGIAALVVLALPCTNPV